MSSVPLTRAEISLYNLDYNLALLRELAGGRPLWPAVKADAYGHGAEIVVQHLLSRGIDTFGVAHVREAVELLKKGIKARYVILSPDLGDSAPEIAAEGLEPVVATERQLTALSAEADRQGRTIGIHVKFDTGMGRVGFDPDTAEAVLALVSGLPGLSVAGLMSHFPRADEGDREYSLEQIQRFKKVLKRLSPWKVPLVHMANSAAIFDLPSGHFDVLRPGIALYGLKPSGAINNSRVDDLKPVLSVKTAITQLKEVPAKTGLSYGHSYVTDGPSLIATVPAGYGDGLARSLSNRIDFLVGGLRCPQVGTICMDQCLIDVTHLRGTVALGDEVVIIGSQGSEYIGADDQAEVLKTINYEIVTRISGRVPRMAVK